ncbi:DUF1127 domain-containing protein [Microvirga guangxiensis]|uniref:DUF1127 domain-containing protein n=1 Tax=Microvirga guangxiensis TaxID=549386 RepID=A0A1G5L8C5_9HYPH|nr:DUF1127 domain-containing protein [Microvirga guangxiensis]SCZ08701.1 protein of unknown function [Microvirga guangxiensis]
MLTLLSSFLRREQPVATHREMLSLRDLDDHLLRDIGLRRIELHAVAAERLLPACCSRATRRWAELVARLRNALSPEPVPCCQS